MPQHILPTFHFFTESHLCRVLDVDFEHYLCKWIWRCCLVLGIDTIHPVFHFHRLHIFVIGARRPLCKSRILGSQGSINGKHATQLLYNKIRKKKRDWYRMNIAFCHVHKIGAQVVSKLTTAHCFYEDDIVVLIKLGRVKSACRLYTHCFYERGILPRS